jgi:5-methylcytosine-specific restriction endonuclease McrA
MTEAEFKDLAHRLGDYLKNAHWAQIKLPGMRESHMGVIFKRQKDYWKFRILVEERIRSRLHNASKPKKENNRNWLKSQLGPGFSSIDLLTIWNIQKGECYYCGKSLGTEHNRSRYHADHIRSLSLGGRHHPRNIAVCCPHCNVRKSDLTFPEFMRQLKVSPQRIQQMHKIDVIRRRTFPLSDE